MQRSTDLQPAPPSHRSSAGDAAGPRPWEAAGLGLILLGSLAARWPFRQAPLIRDEGEYAQLGQAILQGAIPYLEIYNQKPPVTHYAMAALQGVAGSELATLRVATGLYGVVTTLVLFAVARRLFGPAAALWTAGAFAVLTAAQTAVVHSASTEFFMLLWSAATLFFWYRGGVGHSVAAGACAAIACQTKQTGLVLFVFLASDLVWTWLRGRTPRVSEFVGASAGFAGVLAIVAAFFLANGALAEYLECVWSNNFAYVGSRQGGLAQLTALAGAVLDGVAREQGSLWLLAAAGLGALAWEDPDRAGGLWLLLAGSLAAAFLAGAPFAHYYIPLAVPVALGVGVAMTRIQERLAGPARIAVLAVALLCWLPMAQTLASALRDPSATLETVFAGLFPARESPQVARYIAERTSPGEPFIVIGSQPEIYFHADRPPASRMVFSYPMSGRFPYAPRLRQELIDALEAEDRPRYAVFVGYPPSLATNGEDAERFVRHVSPSLLAHYEEETRIPANLERPHMVIYRRKESQ